LRFTFTLLAVEQVTIQAPTGGVIAIGTNSSATSGNITSSNAFASVSLYTNGSTQWIATSVTGPWQVN
jgi:hypothetical protein